MYVSASSIPVAYIASSKGGYTHRPVMYLFRLIPARHRTTLWCNPPRVRNIPGVITQVSDTNKKIACTTALKKLLAFHTLHSSFPKILDKHAHFFLSTLIFCTNSVQMLVDEFRNLPKDLEEVTASNDCL